MKDFVYLVITTLKPRLLHALIHSSAQALWKNRGKTLHQENLKDVFSKPNCRGHLGESKVAQ